MPVRSGVLNLGILAIKGLNFNGKKIKGGNQLTLDIIKGREINKAIIWRSEDGINFSRLGQMVVNATSGQHVSYAFTDNSISSLAFFYKAEVGLSNGNSELTKIVKIDGLKQMDLSLNPNPASGLLNVSFDNIHEEPVVIHILNSAGIIVLNASTKNNYLQLNSETFSNGLYEVQLFKNNELLQNKKLVVQH